MTDIHTFDTTLEKTNQWLREIKASLGWDQSQRAYLALRSVLHALRDRLPVMEAVHFGAQLPMLVRGFYYEGWTPLGKPVKCDRGEFFECIRNAFRHDPDIDPAHIVQAVLAVAFSHIDQGEMRKICSVLPQDFAGLWPFGAAA
jgi:uncharacterized protein (DUF2267 family)